MLLPKHVDEFQTDCVECLEYELIDVIGRGSYGTVFKALEKKTQAFVAIKKIKQVFDDLPDTQRILREIKFLKCLDHPNIIRPHTVLTPRNAAAYNTIYVVLEYMDCDLGSAIKLNKGDFDPDHYRFFLFQMLNGLRCLHAADIFHRDIKPANILVNADCKLKICDFGLSRIASEGDVLGDDNIWTSYVVSRWYRAPELFYATGESLKYTKSIDIWSVGCIFAELLLGYPLFSGKTTTTQFALIVETLGSPSDVALTVSYSRRARDFIQTTLGRYADHGYEPFRNWFIDYCPQCEEAGMDLLSWMLSMDPDERPTVDDALKHEYFDAIWRQIDGYMPEMGNLHTVKEAVANAGFDFDKKKDITADELSALILAECQGAE